MNKHVTTIIRPHERYTEISSGDMTRIAGVAKETSNSKNINLAAYNCLQYEYCQIYKKRTQGFYGAPPR